MFILIILQHSPPWLIVNLSTFIELFLFASEIIRFVIFLICCNYLCLISPLIAAACWILVLPPASLPHKSASAESRSMKDLLSSISTLFVSSGGLSFSLSGDISNGYSFWSGLLMVSFSIFLTEYVYYCSFYHIILYSYSF